MKKMLIVLSAVLLLASGCGNKTKTENLINYVPADADGVVSVDSERLINLSQLQDLRKENSDFNASWIKLESELLKYGLKTSDLPSRLMIFFKVDAGTQNAAILAITKITEAKLINLLKANKATVSYSEKTIADHKSYVVIQKNKEKDEVVITYLKNNLVLICDGDKAEQFFKVVGKTKNDKLIAASKKADPKALISVLYAKEAKAAPAVPAAPAAPALGMPPMGGPLDNVKSAVIDLDLIGDKQKDINLKADLDCKDAKNASQMAMQLKTVVMIMGMQFGQDPALSKSLTEAIKIDQKESNIKINIAIPEALLKKIQASVEAKKKQVLARKSAPAPMPAGPVKAAPSKRVNAAPRAAAPVKASK